MFVLAGISSVGGAARAETLENPRQFIESTQDVSALERIAGSLEEAEKVRPRGSLLAPKILRAAAYVRLGELDTAESLAAIERIEKKAKNSPARSPTVSLSLWSHPADHFEDAALKPLAQVKAPNGRTYAIVDSPLLGGLDLFLISSDDPEKGVWARPMLIPADVYRSIREPSLTATREGVLLFSFIQEKPGPRGIMEPSLDPGKQAPIFGKREIEISVAQVAKDSDGDGWTDAEEVRLGLDPNKADTDGDGLKDGDDVTPDYAPKPGDAASDEAAVIQKAVFAAFGLSGSHYALLVGAKSRKVQLWGYSGPILYGQDAAKWRKEYGYGAVFVDWEVTIQGAAAEVMIRDHEGPLAASSQRVVLQKKNGKWIVIKRQMGPIS